MPSFDGFSAWVKTGRSRREEYNIATDVYKRTIECDIISETDEKFTVHWQAPPGAADFCVHLFLDGKFVDDIMDPAEHGRRSSGSFKDVRLNERFVGVFAFRKPTFGADVEGYDLGGFNAYRAPNREPLIRAKCPRAKNIGTIHVEIIPVEIYDTDTDTDTDSTSDDTDDLEDEGDAEGTSKVLPEWKSKFLTHTWGYYKKEVPRKKLETSHYDYLREPLHLYINPEHFSKVKIPNLSALEREEEKRPRME